MHGKTPHAPTFALEDRTYESAPVAFDFVFVSADLAPRVAQVEVNQATRSSDHQPVLVSFR